MKHAERDPTEARSLAMFQAGTFVDESRIAETSACFFFSSFQNPRLLLGAVLTLETYLYEGNK